MFVRISVVLALMFPVIGGCSTEQQSSYLVDYGFGSATAQIKNETFDLQHASTPEQKLKGLSNRSFPPDKNGGMLFSFVPKQRVWFWMKDTEFALDIVFIADGKVIKIFESVPPCPSEENCQKMWVNGVTQVIELQSGTVSRLRLETGDAVTVKY